MSDTLSLRAFARQLGVSDNAVRKAIRSGRLCASIGRRGDRPVILDLDLARREWAEHRTQPARPRRPAAETRPARTVEPSDPAPSTLHDLQVRIARQRERKLQLENDTREGALLPVERVERVMTSVIAAARARLLALPHAAVLAGLPPAHAPLLREIITTTLDELAAIRDLATLDAAGEGEA